MPTLRTSLLLSAILLSACAAGPRPLPLPPPAPIELVSPAPMQEAVTARGLLQLCRAAAPSAHPWRARQIESSILRYELSRSYHSCAAQMSQVDLLRAEAQEREAWSVLWDTCRPAVATMRQGL